MGNTPKGMRTPAHCVPFGISRAKPSRASAGIRILLQLIFGSP